MQVYTADNAINKLLKECYYHFLAEAVYDLDS